ncbi:MAG: hypothetical protein AAGK32_07965, partial [Actinomycetota bacterium]
LQLQVPHAGRGAIRCRLIGLARRITAGGVKVNGASPISLHLMAPRPAWGVSGLYDEGTLETIQFFMGTTVLGVEGPVPGGPPPDDAETGDD